MCVFELALAEQEANAYLKPKRSHDSFANRLAALNSVTGSYRQNVRLDDLLPADTKPTDTVWHDAGERHAWDYHPFEQGFRHFVQAFGDRVARVVISPSGLRTGTLTLSRLGGDDIRPLTDREIDAVILGALGAVAS